MRYVVPARTTISRVNFVLSIVYFIASCESIAHKLIITAKAVYTELLSVLENIFF